MYQRTRFKPCPGSWRWSVALIKAMWMSPASRSHWSKAQKEAVDFSEKEGVKFSVKLRSAAIAVLFEGNKTWAANCADCAHLSSSETNNDVNDVIFKTEDRKHMDGEVREIPIKMVLCNLARSSRLMGKIIMGVTRSLAEKLWHYCCPRGGKDGS